VPADLVQPARLSLPRPLLRPLRRSLLLGPQPGHDRCPARPSPIPRRRPPASRRERPRPHRQGRAAGPAARDPAGRRQRPAPGHRGPAGPGRSFGRTEPGQGDRALPVPVVLAVAARRVRRVGPVGRARERPGRRRPGGPSPALRPERRLGRRDRPDLSERAELRRPRRERRHRIPPRRGRLS
jgi:hypothetical protein